MCDGFKNLVVWLVVLHFFIVPCNALVFENGGTEYVNVTIPYSEISKLRFNVTGVSYNGEYPNNVTIDVVDDGINDWEYFSYHSQQPLETFNISYARLTNQGTSRIDIVNISEGEFSNFYLLGSLEYNEYQDNLYRPGNLGVVATYNLDEWDYKLNRQMLYLTGNDTAHAFLPYASELNFALYVAEGGSTYFCNSAHEQGGSSCNLTFAEAFTNEHLAREAGQGFNYTESVKGDSMLTSVNDYLSGCSSFPCDVPIKVTSETSGNLSFSQFDVIPPSEPATIDITDNGDSFTVDITPDLSLENTYYLFGKMPKVHIVPVVAGNDLVELNASQRALYEHLNNTLASSWDALTNNSHPLNFTFYNTPYSLENYSTGQQYTEYLNEITDDLKNNLEMTHPSILVVVDVHNYFPERESYNIRRSKGNIISTIYINGFGNNDGLKNDNGYQVNLFMHELMHSFTSYPGGDEFYNDHPASYSDTLNLDIYDTSNSPTAGEGYFEIYSIVNQVRLVIDDSEIGVSPQLSSLDKMLLGTENMYGEKSYTFYSASVTENSNEFSISGITPELNYDARKYYSMSNDNMWWDVRRNSSINDMETSTSYLIPKEENKALWVYANDQVYSENFRVYNSGNSIKHNLDTVNNQSISYAGPNITLQSPSDGYSAVSPTLTLSCFGENAKNMTLYGNWSGVWNSRQTEESQQNYVFSVNLADGDYVWNCYGCNQYGNCSWGDANHSLNIYTPTIVYDESEFNMQQTTNFSGLNKSTLSSLNNAEFTEADNKSKIEFLESINISRNIDLRSELEPGDRWAYVDSAALPEFNKNAQIQFFDIDMQEPKVLRDGTECPTDVCTNNSFANGVYSFQVSGFSNYSIVEGYEEPSQDPPDDSDDDSGGGGSGGGSSGGPSHPIIVDDDESDDDSDEQEGDEGGEKIEVNGNITSKNQTISNDDINQSGKADKTEDTSEKGTRQTANESTYIDEKEGENNVQIALFFTILFIAGGALLGLLIYLVCKHK